MENKEKIYADILQVLRGIKELNKKQKDIVVPILHEDVLKCLYECVRTAIHSKKIPKKTRSQLAKRLKKKKETVRFLADRRADLETKRKITKNLKGSDWSHIIEAVLPLLSKVFSSA